MLQETKSGRKLGISRALSGNRMRKFMTPRDLKIGYSDGSSKEEGAL
jgi:hypothetical protein